MDEDSRRGLRMVMVGAALVIADLGLNDHPFALFTGFSATGNPVVPLAGLVFGACFLLCGVLLLAGVVSRSSTSESAE